jgi:hypothetical protein
MELKLGGMQDKDLADLAAACRLSSAIEDAVERFSQPFGGLVRLPD